ncbi:auxin-responsive protein SAUR78-like [Nicotiana tomentosiformis]|uniref:auxin-responsive protein SAUR78-like n=1 Tax=Nicotiana tomentosiformis TaxID=4098 RepID=UPI0008783AB5|nr:auxin-responsive protein SAUR78-like [Nicotiana tomentosiformis]
MDCIVLPVAILTRRCSGRLLGYRPLVDDGYGDSDDLITVVVGKEKRNFLVEPFVLEESPFRTLIEMVRKEDKGRIKEIRAKKVIYVDVDAILFEHMLWLMQNDCSSWFQFNLKEIIDFYAQDI